MLTLRPRVAPGAPPVAHFNVVGTAAPSPDLDRHRASVVAWLRERGYTSYLPPDALKLVRRAHLDPEEVLMSLSTEAPARAGANGRPRRPETAPDGPVTLTRVDAPPPPRLNQHAGRWQAVIDQLRGDPGSWYHAGVHSTSVAYTLRRKGVTVTTRANGDRRKAEFYLRWPPSAPG